MQTLICPKCDDVNHVPEGMDGSTKLYCSTCGHYGPLYTFQEVDADAPREEPNHVKKKILLYAGEIMGGFLFYDRKFKKSELALDEVEDSIIDGIVTVDEIMEVIRNSLIDAVENHRKEES